MQQAIAATDEALLNQHCLCEASVMPGKHILLHVMTD